MRKSIFIFLFSGFLYVACQPEEASFTLFTIGDSTMANKKAAVYPETGWCQVLEDYLDPSVRVKNHAVNGRSTKSFLEEGRWNRVLDSLKAGDRVFIQFGHNDQKEYDTTRFTTPFGSYTANLKRFIEESEEKGAMPVLFTSIVRRKFEDHGRLIDTHGDYPVAVRKIAEEMNVPLVDLQKLTEEWIGSLGDEASRSMYVWTEPDQQYPEGRQDDTHLSETGAREVARMALKECVSQKLIPSRKIRVNNK